MKKIIISIIIQSQFERFHNSFVFLISIIICIFVISKHYAKELFVHNPFEIIKKEKKKKSATFPLHLFILVLLLLLKWKVLYFHCINNTTLTWLSIGIHIITAPPTPFHHHHYFIYENPKWNVLISFIHAKHWLLLEIGIQLCVLSI